MYCLLFVWFCLFFVVVFSVFLFGGLLYVVEIVVMCLLVWV